MVPARKKVGLRTALGGPECCGCSCTTGCLPVDRSPFAGRMGLLEVPTCLPLVHSTPSQVLAKLGPALWLGIEEVRHGGDAQHSTGASLRTPQPPSPHQWVPAEGSSACLLGCEQRCPLAP